MSSLRKKLRPFPASRALRCAILAVALAGLLAACGAPPEEVSRTSLKVGLQQEPDLLNPMLSSMVVTTYASNFVHGFLMRGDPNLGSIPDLLIDVPTPENGGISEDFLTWTLRLREDALWHDGEPVTSADVRFTYELAMHPDTPVVSRHGWSKIQTLETPDEHTVVIRLDEPFAPFEVTLGDYPILPEHILRDVPPSQFRDHHYNRHPVGAGPFRLVEWDPGSHMRFEAMVGYFRGRAGLDEVVLRFASREQDLLDMLRIQEIDAYERANTRQFQELIDMSGIRVFTTRSLTWEHVDLNCEDPVLSDPRVRRALSIAVDRNRLSEEVYHGLYAPGYSDRTPLSWAYNPKTEELLRHDLDEARRLLEDAGWRDEDGDGIRERDGRPLRLEVMTTKGRPDRERALSVLAQMWRKVGVAAESQPELSTTMFESYEGGGLLARGHFQMALYAWSNLPDPDSYTVWGMDQIPLPPRQRGPEYTGGQNHPRWRNPEATDLLRRAARILDREERRNLYHEFQTILAIESPAIPLVAVTHLDAYPADIRGFVPHPARQTNSWNCWEWR